MRGAVSPDLQLQATVNWFTTRNPIVRARRRLQGWGPMADFGIGFSPKVGRVEIVQFGDPLTTRANWAAGYGAHGSHLDWGVDEVALAIELDQSAKMEPYREETIDALVELALWLPHIGVEIEPVYLGAWDQLKSEPIPTGWLGHDDTANGWRLGKSDPGLQFKWEAFIRRITPAPPALEPVPDPSTPHHHILTLAPAFSTGPGIAGLAEL